MAIASPPWLITGNHDHYNDKLFTYYLAYSIQGIARGTTQHSWIRELTYGKYHFLGIATTGNDGVEFSIWPWENFGDNAKLTSGEIAFIDLALATHSDAEITFMFGHHPFEAGTWIQRRDRPGDNFYQPGGLPGRLR